MRKGVIVQKKALRMRRRIAQKPKLTAVAMRNRAKKVRTVLAGILGLFVAGLFGYFLFFSPFSEIAKVTVRSQAPSVFDAEVKETIRAYKEERKGFLFSKGNFFFFSCFDLRNRLEERFPSLSHIAVEKKFPDVASVSFTERSPVAKWCSSQRCLWLDREGYAFTEASEAQNVENANTVPIIEDETASDEVAIREMPVGRDVLDRTLLWDDFFRSRLNFSGAARYFVEPKTFEEYRIQTEKGWNVRVAKNVSLEDTFETLRAFLETLPPERRDALESIDLRVDGKVFFTEKKDPSTEAMVQNAEDAAQKEDGNEREKKKKE